MTDIRDRAAAVREARELLGKAHGVLALATFTCDPATIAQAFFFASVALLRLADADEDERGRNLIVALLDSEKARRAAEVLT